MKIKCLLLSFCAILITGLQAPPSKAQSIEVLGGNILNGAVTGTILGGATMALRGSNDFAPLRIGLGAGTLFGIGAAVYDLTHISKGQFYYVSGTFNDGENSSIIVLLDTFYGAAAGAVIASSFSLMANEPIGEALQYGSGIGTFAGFGFGLIDGFILAEKPGDFGPSPSARTEDRSGMVSISGRQKEYHLNLLNPAVYTTAELSSGSMGIRYAPGVDIFNLKIEL